ncbi:MAG: AAA family ATPase [Candidatus Methanomethylophilaceae archaeon]|nr:AAA family ATPase [Candidatus Methanomethylophilaceae archaeon]
MFERASAVIKDGNKLSFEYVPEKLVHREKQMERLEMLFRPMVMEGRSCSAFLIGGVGTGKTVTAKRFCDNMLKYCGSKGKLMDKIFVNCRLRNTEYSVILQLVRHYDPGFPDRGFSASDMMRALRIHIESGMRPLVIVLDEVDMLLKNNSKDLIYQLSRYTEDIKGVSSVSMIMISQESIVKLLDQATMSTFKRANSIVFDRYTKEELRGIIKIRADEALITGTIEDDIIDLLADFSEGYGDARFAIELIEKSAQIAESGTEGYISADDVRTANAMIYSDVSENKLISLDLNKKLALLAISRAIKKETIISITSAEKTYAIVCEEYDQVARKHTQFWTYIQDMEHRGLLETSVRSEIDGGRVTYISIPGIPPKELAKKLEYLLETPTSTDECEY